MIGNSTSGYDILHWNSVEPAGDSVIASFRHLDAVYKFEKSTGKIVWKLGGTQHVPEPQGSQRTPTATPSAPNTMPVCSLTGP